ncbi:hypothetical protein HHX47_DHR6000308 [Lentinula edodes]|nr:hypothetical protein HHX47_DHR6000308 [Lentinula edodes]
MSLRSGCPLSTSVPRQLEIRATTMHSHHYLMRTYPTPLIAHEWIKLSVSSCLHALDGLKHRLHCSKSIIGPRWHTRNRGGSETINRARFTKNAGILMCPAMWDFLKPSQKSVKSLIRCPAFWSASLTYVLLQKIKSRSSESLPQTPVPRPFDWVFMTRESSSRTREQ